MTSELKLYEVFGDWLFPQAAKIKEKLINQNPKLKYRDLLEIASGSMAALELVQELHKELMNENMKLRIRAQGVQPSREVDFTEFLTTRQNTANEATALVSAVRKSKSSKIGNMGVEKRHAKSRAIRKEALRLYQSNPQLDTILVRDAVKKIRARVCKFVDEKNLKIIDKKNKFQMPLYRTIADWIRGLRNPKNKKY